MSTGEYQAVGGIATGRCDHSCCVGNNVPSWDAMLHIRVLGVALRHTKDSWAWPARDSVRTATLRLLGKAHQLENSSCEVASDSHKTK